MPSLPSNRKPIFLWQALLILLPVATVTGIGLIAIRRDRVFVEEEARRGGEQLAAQCASAIARSLPLKLAAYDRFSQAWSEQQQLKARSLWHEPSDEPFAALSNSWRKATANLDPESGLPNDFACSFDGVLLWPPDYDDPPRIPQWLIRLNDQQRSAWQALLAAEFSGSSGTNLESKVDEFLNSEPPEEARLNADLITVHHESFKENNLQEFLGLQAFGARCSRARSESGLPLTTLIALEGLRAGRQPGAQYNLLAVDMNDSGGFVGQTLDWSFHEPSVLTPVIIGQLEQMVPSAAQSARLMPAIKAAWARWAAQQRFHQMARLIRSQGLLRNASPTNFWLQCDSGLWFCAATSGRIALRQTMADSSAVWTTNEAALLRTYPAGFIDQAAEQCVHELGPSIPDYAGVQFRIERELVGTVERAEQLSFQAVPIGVLGSDPHRNHRVGGSYFLEGTKAATKTSSRVLAETLASFESYPDAWSINMRAVLPEAVMLPGGTRSSVRFKLQLLLIDPDRLFMRQRQRSWFFGGVILASAFTACVGLAAAYRSFRRQLRLNELKSNFVSSVSHELRAPIASVRLMAESLDRGKIGDPRKQHEYFRFIVQECRRLSSLIENVLDFSRIEQGRKELEFEPTDIRALTDQ